ncbi:uncharacterized protein [Ptychodera flava]|uniref:uncharacterized protein isoform X2 n=1 Tax=Ptychodera flava TaxID=63121 RepID=UPI00396A3E6E
MGFRMTSFQMQIELLTVLALDKDQNSYRDYQNDLECCVFYSSLKSLRLLAPYLHYLLWVVMLLNLLQRRPGKTTEMGMTRVGTLLSFGVGAAFGVLVFASVSQLQWYWNQRKKRKAALREANRLTESIQALVESERREAAVENARESAANESFLTNTADQGMQHSLIATPNRSFYNDEHSEDLEEDHSGKDNQSLLNLLFNIAEVQGRRGYVHRGISCNSCNASPLCGVRYRCANCVDYDICERCEPRDCHNRNHLFIKIKIPIPPLANPRQPLFKQVYMGREEVVKKLTWGQTEKLKSQTHFDQFEIESLHEQYKSLCTSEKGVSREVYDSCLGPLGQEKNLVLDRLFKFYDKNGDGYIDFDEMVNGLSVLVKGNHKEKVAYAFAGYDLDSEGGISRDNLRKMFKAYFYISIELVRDVVKACEEEMMSNFDDSQGKPVSSLFSAPIPSDTGAAAPGGKMPFPGNPGGREGMWPVMEAMSQDAIDEMVVNIFKMAKVDIDSRISFENFEKLAILDNSLIAWFDALGTVF